MTGYQSKGRKKELQAWFAEQVEWILSTGIVPSQRALADKLNVKPSIVSDILHERIGVSRSVEKSMRNYLKTITEEVNETAPPYLKAVSKIEGGEKGINLIQVYLVKATAERIEFQKSTQKIAMPNISNSEQIMAVKMWGDFLAPQFTATDFIAFRRLTNTNVLQYGMPHIIRTKEQLIARLLMPGEDPNTYVLKSTDPERYPDIVLEKQLVEDIYIILDKTSPPGGR